MYILLIEPACSPSRTFPISIICGRSSGGLCHETREPCVGLCQSGAGSRSCAVFAARHLAGSSTSSDPTGRPSHPAPRPSMPTYSRHASTCPSPLPTRKPRPSTSNANRPPHRPTASWLVPMPPLNISTGRPYNKDPEPTTPSCTVPHFPHLGPPQTAPKCQVAFSKLVLPTPGSWNAPYTPLQIDRRNRNKGAGRSVSPSLNTGRAGSCRKQMRRHAPLTVVGDGKTLPPDRG
jgi:hypothetical protein